MEQGEVKKSFARKNIKWLIVGSAFILSLVVQYVVTWNNSPFLATIRIVQYDGFISIGYLFLAMFAGPFYRVFPNAPLKQIYRESLSGLGISCFYFALLHSWIGFWSLLAGFPGLKFLSTSYLISTILGTIALLILAIMAGISFEWMRLKLGSTWKFIQRFVYLAAVLTVIHVLILGSNFLRFTSVLTTLSVIAFLVLLILHAVTTHRLLLYKYSKVPAIYFSIGVSAVVLLFLFSLYKLHMYIAGVHLH